MWLPIHLLKANVWTRTLKETVIHLNPVELMAQHPEQINIRQVAAKPCQFHWGFLTELWACYYNAKHMIVLVSTLFKKRHILERSSTLAKGVPHVGQLWHSHWHLLKHAHRETHTPLSSADDGFYLVLLETQCFPKSRRGEKPMETKGKIKATVTLHWTPGHDSGTKMPLPLVVSIKAAKMCKGFKGLLQRGKLFTTLVHTQTLDVILFLTTCQVILEISSHISWNLSRQK